MEPKTFRKAFAPPETAMERHVEELVKHLKEGVDNRSGFAAKIEAAMSHAWWLEAEVRRLKEENQELDLAVLASHPFPTMTAQWKGDVPTYTMQRILAWEMEPLRWRTTCPQLDDIRQWRLVRRRAYRALLRRIRRLFSETYPDVPIASRQSAVTV